MMNNLEITFEGASPADASRFAEDLSAFLESNVEGIEASVTGNSSQKMDFGATVVIVLGTPAVVYLAKGLADWIKRQGDPELSIKTKKGSIVVKSGLDMEAKKQIILAALDKGDL